MICKDYAKYLNTPAKHPSSLSYDSSIYNSKKKNANSSLLL